MVYNHSFSPNAEWEIYEKDGRFVRFFALKDIKKGEEIFHDYGEEYWDTREEKVK
jgi:SET domain-containing protein